MNLANRITVARVLIVPFFVLCLYQNGPWIQVAAVILFIIGAVSDTVDGRIARSRGEETNFGRILDPLADKFLVISALVVMVDREVIPGVPVLLIIARELGISGLRILAAKQGVVISASPAGKNKTASQIVAICFGLLSLLVRQFDNSDEVLGALLPWIHHILPLSTVWIAAGFSVYSGTQYIVRNWSLLDRASKS